MELKPGYKQTEVGVIPESWDVQTLPSISWFQEGPGLRNWQFTRTGMKVINVTNLENNVLNLERTDRHISISEFERMYQHFAIDAGDIVMASSGNSYSKTAVVRQQDLPLVMNTSVIRFKPLKGCDYKFLWALLNSPLFKNQIDLMITGGAQPNFGPYHLKRVNAPVPPLAEQRAIATALSDVNALLDGLDRLIAKKRDLKQVAMQQLLTGETRLPGFEGEWVERKLVELADFYDNLRIPVTESKREIGITPYYGANGIQGYIKGHTHDGEFVLIAEDGANDLNNYPVFYVNGKVWVNNHAHVIQGIPDKAKTKYLSYALKNVDFVQVLVGGTRAKLNGSEAKAIKTIIPSDIEEQTAIATVLSDMDAEIATLEQRRAKTKNIKQAMMQELLTGKTRLVTPGGSNA